jgi:hypothetical protein
MLDNSSSHRVSFTPISVEKAKALFWDGVQSAVGHEVTAQVISTQLGIEVPFNRTSVALGCGNSMIVAQATMPRLAEGQVLSHEEMLAVPITYWYLNSDEDVEE